ncbi:MAG TPA: cell division protein FtsZ [Alphaproteobacteria bacterium]|nr:cell division protein FtsZ [Alphaproteobacteria bacterium]
MINLSMADPEHNLRPRLTVMGVGGAGGNAINNMIRCQLEGCDFIAANTDSQALAMSLAPRKIQLGINLSRGLGAGSKADAGRAAAEEQVNDIMAVLDGSDMLFVTAGMGGGTGTGAAPVIARAAREAGILTVGVVTKPFHFEGSNRMKQAEGGIAELQQYVDTLIVIPNQNLFRIANERTTFAEAFRLADEVLHCGVRGITDLMVMPGFMNLDFADVKTVMGEMGKAMMGTGEADGDNRAIRAAEAAISNPLLDDVSMKGARGVLINITGGMDMTLFEVDQAANRIREEVDPDAQIKVGSTLGENLDGRIRVSVIATGIDASVLQNQGRSGNGHLRVVPSQQTQQRQQAPVQQQVAQQFVPSVSSQYFTMPQAMSPQQVQQPVQQQAPVQQQPVQQQVQPQQQQYQQPAQQEQQQQVEAAAPQQVQQAPVQQPVQQQAPVQQQVQQPVQAQQPQQQAPVQQQAAPAAPRYNPNVFTQRAPLPQMPPASQAQRAAEQQTSASQQQQPFDMRVTQLTSPAQQAAADQRRLRRSESLFTRITGFGLVRPSAQEDEMSDDAQMMTDENGQPRLGIDPADRPALSSEQSSDLLDIPAFLRRQTNH